MASPNLQYPLPSYDPNATRRSSSYLGLDPMKIPFYPADQSAADGDRLYKSVQKKLAKPCNKSTAPLLQRADQDPESGRVKFSTEEDRTKFGILTSIFVILRDDTVRAAYARFFVEPLLRKGMVERVWVKDSEAVLKEKTLVLVELCA